MDNLTWLVHWYYFQCDGSWECEYGLKICLDEDLIWQSAFDISETKNMDKEFREIFIEKSADNWVKSHVFENTFYIQSTLQNLPTSINIFRLAVQNKSEESMSLPGDFLWFLEWCETNQDLIAGKIAFSTIENPGWALSLPLLKTPKLQFINRDQSEDNWVRCQFENSMFQAHCGPLNLIDLFSIFRSQSE